MIHRTAKLSEEVNRKCSTGNMMVQLTTPYTNPEHHNAEHHRQTDRYHRAKSRSSISAKNLFKVTVKTNLPLNST